MLQFRLAGRRPHDRAWPSADQSQRSAIELKLELICEGFCPLPLAAKGLAIPCRSRSSLSVLIFGNSSANARRADKMLTWGCCDIVRCGTIAHTLTPCVAASRVVACERELHAVTPQVTGLCFVQARRECMA